MRERQELAERLRMLRQATKKSQREFAEILGVDHSTVSIYEKPDGRVPDLEYIDGFLAEVASRTDVTADVLKDTRDCYGRLLRLLCDQPQERGRTHNYRQLLRVYELTLEREALTAELAEVREQQRNVEDELNRLQQQTSTGTAADPEREQRLRETAVTLEQRRAVLVGRRDTVVSDLDAYHAQLRQFHIPPPPSTTPAVPNQDGPIVGPPQQLSLPPSSQRNTGPRTRTTAIVASAVVVLLLGGWLIYRTTSSSDDTARQQPPHSPVVTASHSSSPSPAAASDPTATAEYTDVPFTLRGANLSTCVDTTGVSFAGEHPTVESGLDSLQDTSTQDDLFYSACNSDQPFVSVPPEEKFARRTTPPTDAQSCQATAEQNPTANELEFSQIKAGDKFCLVTAALDPHVVYLQVIRIDRAQHDIYWKATSWSG